MSFLATLTAIGLSVLHVPYALTFGVFTGLATIVPFFGTLLATALPVLFVIGGPDGGTRAIWVVVVGIVVHLIEGNVVAPLIMSKKVDLPPVLTIVFVLIIGALLGPLGLLVAVPGLAVIMVIVRRILLTRLYEGQGFRARRASGRSCSGFPRARAASCFLAPIWMWSRSWSGAPRRLPCRLCVRR
jgi:predicted PurR-regulated permease PerM